MQLNGLSFSGDVLPCHLQQLDYRFCFSLHHLSITNKDVVADVRCVIKGIRYRTVNWHPFYARFPCVLSYALLENFLENGANPNDKKK